MMEPIRYRHLHAHGTYSFLDGYGTPKQIVGRIQELGHDSVALTDHGSIFGHIPHQVACLKAGIKPIFGVEAYIVDDMEAKTRHQASIGVDALPHITIIAANQQGYKNLLSIIRESHNRGFYYKPRIDFQFLRAHQDGLVVLSGCVGGYPTQLLIHRGFEEAYKHILTMKQMVEHYFIEIVPEPGLTEFDGTYESLVTIATHLQIPIAITADAHFPRASDHPAQDLLLCVGMGKQLSQPGRMTLPSYQYYCTGQELFDRARAVMPQTPDEVILQGLHNTEIIANGCYAEIPNASPVIFPKVGPSESSEIFLWNKLVEAFGKKRQSGQIKEEDRKVYWERLVYEYDTLKKKNFCDYILVVDDLIRHVKGIGGLVVCRGSAGGSLMLWVLDASCTDPIFHNLSFERFYDENRPDPPDVDIDFEQGFRNQALDYIFNTYGHNNCALIATLSKLQAKAALVDTAFAYGIPRSEFETLSRALDSKDPDTERNLAQISDPEALKVLEKYPQLRIFDQIVGQYRQSSIHAAGVLVSSMPLSESVGVILSKGRDRNIATIDKYGAADLGYLKIDALIVEGLDSIAMACRKIWGTVDPLYTMALDDQKVLRMAGDCKLAGVFQLEGASAARTVREIGIENFEDLVAASALCRPGPSNFIPIYKKNKAQLDSFETSLQGFHPVAADIIRPTYGVILYQEQVMAFARDLALFSHADVAKLRKGVSSSSGDALQQWKEKFVAGCVSNGVSPLESEHWWSTVATHGFYSFNRSHALTYAVIGYWTLYLKTYYPAEFYEAQLARQDDTITRKRLLREFQREGAIIHLLHPEHSRAHTRAIGNEIYGGFSDLFGVGETVAKAIENRAPFEDYASMLDALPARVKDAVLKTWNGTEWNVPALIKLAPWFPVPQDRVRRHGVSPAVLPDTSFSDSVTLEGWVIDTDYSKDKTIVFVEDAFGFACCRVAAKKTKSHGGFVRQIEVGDYVAVQGWWSGDTLYIQDFAIIEKGS